MLTQSELVAATIERLEGKSLATTAGTNFGRDTHEAALGSTVMSVQLSVAEIELLCARLASSDASIRESLTAKLELLRNALVPADVMPGQSLSEVAACVGLGGAAPSVVPVTVLTGCLGAGKTTVIRWLLRQLPPGYTCAWLKNEYGDAGVDKMVAQDARVAVKEIVNGCLCCTKVGELADALRALHDLGPHRILVEASGSALPGPLVWEIAKEAEIVRIDGVVTVVDCANFARINNFSRTAKIQAKCTDLVLLNKVRFRRAVERSRNARAWLRSWLRRVADACRSRSAGGASQRSAHRAGARRPQRARARGAQAAHARRQGGDGPRGALWP